MILILGIGGLAVLAHADARELPGDGFEYLMMPVSLESHGTTAVTDDDIERAKWYYGNNIFDTIYRDRADTTLVTGSDGNLYAKHFGFYSVLCMPLRAVFHYLLINPAKAFLYMNLLFWMAACLVVQFGLNADQFKKTVLIVFLVINPAWFYLTWVHTEILMYSLAVISLVARYNGKYVKSMLFMSLAAVCNLTLLVPCLIIGIEFLINAVKEDGKLTGKTVRKTVPVLIAAVPGFIPVIRSYILFGSYSPVAAVAAVASSSDPVDSRLICGLSYIFDPNQGMIIYTLLIVPAFIVIAVSNLIRRKDTARTVLELILIAGMIFIVSHELHINCGMSYIMRYNIWMLPFMAFFDVFYIKPKVSSFVFGISALWTAFVIILFSFVSGPDLYLEHTLFGKWALSELPSVYNPPVGIFYSRTLTEESYYCDFPVPFYDDDGNLRKIMLTAEAEDLIEGGEWTVYGPDMTPVMYSDLPSTNINGPEFTYININDDGYHMVRDTDKLDFSDLEQTDVASIRSSVGYEGESALVYGKELNLLFHILPGHYTGRFGLANVFGGVQNITVSVNGNTVYSGPVSIDDDSFSFGFDVGDDFVCDIRIDIPGALRPADVVPGSADDRVLSLYLTDFTYSRES